MKPQPPVTSRVCMVSFPRRPIRDGPVKDSGNDRDGASYSHAGFEPGESPALMPRTGRPRGLIRGPVGPRRGQGGEARFDIRSFFLTLLHIAFTLTLIPRNGKSGP